VIQLPTPREYTKPNREVMSQSNYIPNLVEPTVLSDQEPLVIPPIWVEPDTPVDENETDLAVPKKLKTGNQTGNMIKPTIRKKKDSNNQIGIIDENNPYNVIENLGNVKADISIR